MIVSDAHNSHFNFHCNQKLFKKKHSFTSVCLCESKCWTQYVCTILEGQKCGSSYRDDGICKKVTNCPSALEALSKRRPHNMNRCGFDGAIEVVCCPTSDVREFRDRDNEKPNLWTTTEDGDGDGSASTRRKTTTTTRDGLTAVKQQTKRKSEIGQ